MTMTFQEFIKNVDNKFLDVIGISLSIVGSFLPWEQAGDFLSFQTIGIRVDFANFKYWITGIHEFPVYDNGGLLVLLLTTAFLLFTLQSPGFHKKYSSWMLLISVLLMGLSLFYVARWFFHRYEYGDAIGRPTLMCGLICVVLGSIILFWQAIMIRRQVVFQQNQNPA